MTKTYQQKYEQTPMGKYIRQRANAKERGIPWMFTFETWWEVWEKSGKWGERGRRPGQFFMCRTGDSGHYGPDNVRIDSISGNAFEAWQVRKEHKERGKKDPFSPYPRTSAWDYPGSEPVVKQVVLEESTESA